MKNILDYVEKITQDDYNDIFNNVGFIFKSYKTHKNKLDSFLSDIYEKDVSQISTYIKGMYHCDKQLKIDENNIDWIAISKDKNIYISTVNDNWKLNQMYVLKDKLL